MSASQFNFSKTTKKGKGKDKVVDGFQKYLMRREMNINQPASIKLKTALSSYSISPERRNVLKNEMMQFENLHRMNMKYLAASLYMLETLASRLSSEIAFSPADFDQNTEPMNEILQQLEQLNKHDTLATLTKKKTTILTYMLAIIALRQEKNVDGEIIYAEASSSEDEEDELDEIERLPLPGEEVDYDED
jgi:hypothetical protein